MNKSNVDGPVQSAEDNEAANSSKLQRIDEVDRPRVGVFTFGLCVLAFWLLAFQCYWLGLPALMELIQPNDYLALVVYFGFGFVGGSFPAVAQILTLLRMKNYFLVFGFSVLIAVIQITLHGQLNEFLDFRLSFNADDIVEILRVAPSLIFFIQLPIYLWHVIWGVQLNANRFEPKRTTVTIFQIMSLTAIAAFCIGAFLLKNAGQIEPTVLVIAAAVSVPSLLLFLALVMPLTWVRSIKWFTVITLLWCFLSVVLAVGISVIADGSSLWSLRLNWKIFGMGCIGLGAVISYVTPIAGLRLIGFRLIHFRKVRSQQSAANDLVDDLTWDDVADA